MNPFKSPGRHKIDLAKVNVTLRAASDEDLRSRLDSLIHRVKYSSRKYKDGKANLLYHRHIKLIQESLICKYPEPYGIVLEVIQQCEELLYGK